MKMPIDDLRGNWVYQGIILTMEIYHGINVTKYIHTPIGCLKLLNHRDMVTSIIVTGSV